MKKLDIVAAVALIVGGIDIGLLGLFQFDLIATMFGETSMLPRVLYCVAGLSAAYQVVFMRAIQNRWCTESN